MYTTFDKAVNGSVCAWTVLLRVTSPGFVYTRLKHLNGAQASSQCWLLLLLCKPGHWAVMAVFCTAARGFQLFKGRPTVVT